MKTIKQLSKVVLAALLLVPAISFAQDKTQSNELDFSKVDVKPVFPGCEESMDAEKCFKESIAQHIQKNFKYPEKAEESGIEGKVFVQFTITKEGEIDNVNILRGADKMLDEEALRIVKSLPNVTAAMHNGKKVAIKFIIPIAFKL